MCSSAAHLTLRQVFLCLPLCVNVIFWGGGRGGEQICPGLNGNEIQIPYDKHHKVWGEGGDICEGLASS